MKFIRQLCAFTLLSSLLVAAPNAIGTGTVAAQAADDFTLTKSGPDDALIGEIVTFTLTASNSPTNLYNLGFSDVLPPGTEFVPGSGTPAEPTVFADTPSPGFTTLVWENVSDLPPGSTAAVSYDVDTDPDTNPNTLPVGTTFTNSASAYANSNAFQIPDVDPVTGEFTGDFTGESADEKDTEIVAFRIEKTGAGSLLRGVHDNGIGLDADGNPATGTIGGTVTITITGNPNYPTTDFVVSDSMPNVQEFLGCANYIGADNTTDVPFNGAAPDNREWVNDAAIVPPAPADSGPVTGGPCGASLAPNSVDTTAGGRTEVGWTVPLVPAGGVEVIEYGVGIPMRANCGTFSGAVPAPGSLGQARNLDNNCGEPTNEADMAPWPNPNLPELLTPNEDSFTNFVEGCGAYEAGPTGPLYSACQEDEAITIPEDLVLAKSMDGALLHGDPLAITLTATTGEYRDFNEFEFRDILPDGTCYTGTFIAGRDNTTPASDWATNDCPGAGTVVPTITVGGTTVNAPASSVEELADGRFAVSWNFADYPILEELSSDGTMTVEFGAVVRTTYRENFAPDGAVLSGDSITNTSSVSAGDEVIVDNTEGIDDDPDDETGAPDGDLAEAGLDTPLPSIKKYVAEKTPGPLDNDTAPDPVTNTTCGAEAQNIAWEDSAAGAPATTDILVTGYSPGDLVCFLMTANFPPDLSYAGVQVTDLLPAGYTYVPGSASAVTLDMTDTLGGTIPGDDIGAALVLESPRTVIVDVGDVSNGGASFAWVIGAVLGGPDEGAPGDITVNQQKMVTSNTDGAVFQFRDLAGAVWEEPRLKLAKGIEYVQSPSDDTNTFPGSQGVDFDNSYPFSTSTPQLVEGADIVRYRIDLWNDGNRDATNAEIWDILPPDFDCADVVAGSFVPAGASCLGTGGAGDPFRIVWPSSPAVVTADTTEDAFRPDGTVITYTYDLVVPGDADPGQVHVNTAGVRSYTADVNYEDPDLDGNGDDDTFTYFPDDNIDETATAPTPNTDRADDTAAVFLETASVAKAQWSGIDEAGNISNGEPLPSRDEATIGEIVQYEIELTLPEGTTVFDGVLDDSIPAGLTYFEGPGLFNGTVQTLAPTFTQTSAGASAAANLLGDGNPTIADVTFPSVGSGGAVTFAFPDGDGDGTAGYQNETGSDDDIFTVTFYVQVDDVATLAAGVRRSNRADFNYESANGDPRSEVRSNTTRLDIVEPNPVIVKDHTQPAGDTVLPGQIITWRLQVTNPDGTNVSVLHDLVVVDTLPADVTPLQTPAGAPATATGQTITGPAGAIGVWDDAARTITWSVDTLWTSGQAPPPAPAPNHELTSLDPGGPAVLIDFDVIVDDPEAAGTALLNTATIEGDSIPVDDPSNDPDDQDARPYGDEDDDELFIDEPDLTKDTEPFGVPDPGDDGPFAIGEPFDQSLTVAIPAGLFLFDATVFDDLPLGVTFDTFGNNAQGPLPIISGNCSVFDGVGAAGALTAADIVSIQPTGGDAQRLAWFLGDVISGGDCSITFPYRVHIDDTSFSGDSHTNTAILVWNLTDLIDDDTVIDDLPDDFNDPDEFDEETNEVDETVDVVEPQLQLDKDVQLLTPALTPITGCDVTPGNDTAGFNDIDGAAGALPFGGTDGNGCDVEAASLMRYTLYLDSVGTGPAYDATLIDTVPVGLTVLAAPGGAAVADGGTITGASGSVGIWNDADRTIIWIFAGPLDPTVRTTVDYDAELAVSDALEDEEDLTNTAAVPTYYGLTEAERNAIVVENPSNDDVPTYGSDPTADRGFVDPDETTIEVHFPEVTILKDHVPPDNDQDARLDEPFTWRLTIENTDSVASLYGVDVTDILPVGWTYVPNSAVVTTPYASGPVEPVCTPSAGATCDLEATSAIETIVWTDLVMGLAEPLAPGDQIVIVYDAVPQGEVLNIDNLIGEPQNNAASVQGDDASGSDSCCGGESYEDDVIDVVFIQRFDLALRKTFDSIDTPTLGIGTKVTFNIEVFNQGSIDGFDIEIVDYVQPEWIYDPADNTAALTGNDNDWTGAPGDIVPTLDVEDIPAGESKIVKIVLTLNMLPVVDPIFNLAEITAADDDNDPNNAPPADIDSDPDATNDEWDPADPDNDDLVENVIDNSDGDEDDHDITSIPVFDLALRKTVNAVVPSPLKIGSNVTFDIEVFNQGSTPAFGVEITDYILDGFTYDPALNTAGATGNVNPWVGALGDLSPTLLVGEIAIGSSTTVTIVLTFTSVPANNASLDNAAEITAADDDTDPLNDPPVDIDSRPDDVNDDVVVDDEITAPGVDGNGNSTGEDEDDHDIASLAVFDLALRKTVLAINPAPPVIGSLITYEIEVFNQGSADAFDVTITDYVQGNLQFDPADNTAGVTGNANDWSGVLGDGVSTLDVGDIAAGESVVVQIRLEIRGGTPLENVAEISEADDDDDPDNDPPTDVDSTPDSDPDNDPIVDDEIDDDGSVDEDDHDIAAIPVFDLALRKTVNSFDPDPLKIGSKVTFDVNVFNQGTIDASDVEVTDYVQAGFTFDPADNTAAATGNLNDWTGALGDLTPTLDVGPMGAQTDQTVAIVLTFTSTPPGNVPLENRAEISSADDDGNPNTPAPADIDSTPDQDDDDAVEDDQIDENGVDDTSGDGIADEDDHDLALLDYFDLALIKKVDSVDPTPPVVGSLVTFTMEVINQGSQDAFGVVITDYIVNGFTFDPANNTAAVTGNASDWVGAGGATAPTLAVGDIPSATSVQVKIVLELVGQPPLQNAAEILEADNDTDPDNEAPTDVDSTPDGTNDDPVEDDEIDEDGVTDTTGDGIADEDDHDIAELPVFDLALRKTVTSFDPDPLTIGSNVTYLIEVFNQGDFDAFGVQIIDYVPSGLVYDPASNTALETGNVNSWVGLAGDIAPTLVVGDIPVGTSIAVSIVLQLTSLPEPDPIVNAAEIIAADDDLDSENTPPTDFDSTPDTTNDDPVEDNQLTENGRDDDSGDGVGDEDDHDIAALPSPRFDLALLKALAPDQPGLVDIGDTVTFVITIINQGDVDGFNVGVIDYMPAGLVLSSDDANGWVDNLDGTVSVVVPGPVPVGGQIEIELDALVEPGNTGDLTNVAEITEAEDTFGGPLIDTDSIADSNPGNDVIVDGVVDGTDGDEDDSDPAVIRVREVDLAIDKQASVSTIEAGQEFEWTLVVVNNGPDPEIATITVTDELAAELELVSVEGDGWTCESDTSDEGVPSIDCQFDDGLAVGAAAPPIVITTTSSADTEADVTVTNNASVSSPTPDGNPDNNVSNDTVELTEPPVVPEPPVEPPVEPEPPEQPPVVPEPPSDPLPVVLPETGGDIYFPIVLGLGFVLLGMMLLFARRNRRRPRVIVS